MRVVPASTPTLSFAQRAALYALSLALVLAPVLANLWPAFGKGPMLYAGETAAASSARAGHERHVDHATEVDHATDVDHTADVDHAADGGHDADGGHAADGGHDADPAASHSQHARHCALCVLASLGWAPFVVLGTPDAQHAVRERAAPPAPRVLRAAAPWRTAQPRAPPFSS